MRKIQNLFTSSYFSLRITGFHHEVHEDFTHPIIYNMRCVYRTGNLFNNAIIVTLPFNKLSTEGKVFPLLLHGRGHDSLLAEKLLTYCRREIEIVDSE